jgi:hypothetical protein
VTVRTDTVPAYPTVGESRARLERADWSVRVWPIPLGVRLAATSAQGWQLFSAGATEAEALWRVCHQARAMGLLRADDGDGS